jgi:methylmalonyl-CoA/ethylmalonyl-CoA epimerase
MITSRLHQIAQRADDLDRATAFYRDQLELPLIARVDPPGMAFFDLGNTRLMVATDAPSAILYFEVEDIEAKRDVLERRGVTFLDEVHMIHRDDDGTYGPAGYEGWMTFFRDSEDNMVALAESRPSSGTRSG